MSRFGLAGKQKGIGSIPLRLLFLFKKVVVCGHCLVSRFGLAVRLDAASALLLFRKVVCGHCLVTLSLTVNETLNWLSSLTILMQASFWW